MCEQHFETKQVTTCQDFHSAIEFIGKRWTGTIIYHLLKGPKRYHELLASINGISDRLLTVRLKDLEEEGLLIKKIISSSPKRVEYELTQSGKDFEKVIIAISEWIARKKVNK